MTNALYASLSDAQVARLQNKELVSASELAPEQCDLLGTLYVYVKFSSLPRSWQHYEEFLSAIPASRLKLMKIPLPETGYILRQCHIRFVIWGSFSFGFFGTGYD